MDTSWFQDAKNAFELIRMALGAASDIKALLPEGPQREAATKAIENAEAQTKIAEASIAKALGYELCRCEFPPNPMLTVGYMTRGDIAGKQVYECPKCGANTAGPWAYQRTTPKRL